MKQTIKTLSAAATLSAALILGSCDNAAENQKLMDEDNAKIQTMVDEKMAGLQAEADAACAAQVETMATAAYDEWVAANTKGGKAKPKAPAKPAAAPTSGKTESTEKPKGFGGAVESKDQNAPKGFGGAIENKEEPRKKGFGGAIETKPK